MAQPDEPAEIFLLYLALAEHTVEKRKNDRLVGLVRCYRKEFSEQSACGDSVPVFTDCST